MIVNRIRGDLNLSGGPVSKALLQAAGVSLQDECDKYQQEYGELVIGDILVTNGGELCCQYVFHVNLPLYGDRTSLKVRYIVLYSKHTHTHVCVVLKRCLAGIQGSN